MQSPASVTSEMGTADSTKPEEEVEEVAFQWTQAFFSSWVTVSGLLLLCHWSALEGLLKW